MRLLCGDARPKGPAPREEAIPSEIDGEHEGIEQYTDVGSYAIVEGIPALGATALSLLVWPSLPGAGVQILMALGPVRLILDQAGAAALAVGDKTLSAGRKLRARWWHRVTASYDPTTGAATVSSEPLPGPHAERPAASRGHLPPGTAPVGPPPRRRAGRARPHHAALRRQARGADPALRRDCRALGFFGRNRHQADRGSSPRGLHGTTVNAPKRAVTGSRWDGSVHDWKQDAAHYAAIHFHSDDLYDAGWSESLSSACPATLRSGFYAIKLQASGPPFHVGFIVSPPEGGSGRASRCSPRR